MPKFKYTVRDPRGKTSSGLLEAKDHTELRRMLRVNDLYLTRYRQASQSEPDPNAVQPSLFSKVKPRDIVILIRQMATMVRAGVPITDGLVALEQQVEKPQLKIVMRDLHLGV